MWLTINKLHVLYMYLLEYQMLWKLDFEKTMIYNVSKHTIKGKGVISMLILHKL